MKAVILAGGFGKRLRPYTETVPKPLVEVAGKPILEWQIEWLKKYGITDFVFLVGYLREKIIDFIGSGARLGIKATYVVEDNPLGTAGALKNAEPVLRNEDMFIVVNGDIITNLDPIKLVEFLKSKSDAVGAIAAVPLRSPYGILDIGEDDYVLRFEEKPLLSTYWINAGVYVFRPTIFNYLPEKGDIERTTFPKLSSERKLIALKYTNILWRSIDTYKDIEEAGRELKALHEA
ncbi:MAG: nucleotidyltransferase family protein [Pyrodictiaceae archaeon]